jgi:hypothetical protein
MKKILALTLGLLIGVSTVFASEYTKFSRKFMKHIRDCDSYEETVLSKFEDADFKTTRKIQGWKDGLCRYSETITSVRGGYKLECGFNEAQLDNLYEAMKDRSKKAENLALVLFAERINPKTGETEYIENGTTEIKGNKAYIVWAKYQNNPYICKPSAITIKARDIGKDIKE